MRISPLIGFVLVAGIGWGCGGSSNSPIAPTPNSPGASSPNPIPVGTVNILSSNGQSNLGAQSFSPNPTLQSPNGMVTWHNSDSTTHHIIADDGSFDTGDIAPGETSAAKMPSSGAGVRYHCTIHPTMVGSVSGYWDY